MPHPKQAKDIRHPKNTEDQEMTDTRIETAVALLKARDDTIAALKVTVEEQQVTIRHLKALLHEADHEVARAQALASEAMVERWVE
jgi:multidrug resistance efflux pump